MDCPFCEEAAEEPGLEVGEEGLIQCVFDREEDDVDYALDRTRLARGVGVLARGEGTLVAR